MSDAMFLIVLQPQSGQKKLLNAVLSFSISVQYSPWFLCYSDSTLLMADSFPVLKQLKRLQHLSLSRCYHIHLAALT